MSFLKVTAEQLQERSGTLGRGSESIQQELQTLTSAISPLVDGDWEGAASSQFQGLWQEWQTSGANLREALEGISQLLSSAADAYGSAEEQVKSSMGGPR